MTEQDHRGDDRDPYWQEDLAIGEGRFYRGDSYSIRMRLHTEHEHYHHHRELVPLAQTSGERVYVHGKPYILVPDITLTVGLYPRPTPAGAIGEVTDSEWQGMRHEEIGQAQGWFYPADQLVMLWECFPEERFRRADPTTDATLALLWAGFEQVLLARFPEARRIATTWEDLYPRSLWQEFLTQHGYQPVAPAAFVKRLAGAP